MHRTRFIDLGRYHERPVRASFSRLWDLDDLDLDDGARDTGVVERSMILAAGFGTRLRPLTDECPKPLVPVGDRSLLAHVAAGLIAGGARELVVNTHYKSEEFAKDVEVLRVKVHVLHEVEILGTAGGIAGARHLLRDVPAVVVNGDILCRPPLERLRAEAGEGLTLVVRPREAGAGTVGLGEDGSVVRLRGRSFGFEKRGADYVGVAALGARCLRTLPERGCLVGDWALPELERGGRIATVPLEGEWLDVGSLRAYRQANLAWLEELAEPTRGWFDRAGQGGQLVGEGAWIGPGTRVDARVSLERSVMRAGAVVEGAGVVSGCVVWPGARVRAPLKDAVVTSSGRVVPCLEDEADLR